jgi:hypothetical protein
MVEAGEVAGTPRPDNDKNLFVQAITNSQSNRK